jgi:hypothetical protein
MIRGREDSRASGRFFYDGWKGSKRVTCAGNIE